MHFTWLAHFFDRRTPTAAPAIAPDVRPRLLLVEDDWSTHAALRRIFARRGWEVDSASTTAGALAMLELRPRAMILDLMLADGAGLEVLRRVRSERAAIRVVVTTGSTDLTLRAEVLRFTPDALLTKPVDLQDLLDAIRDED